MSYREPTPPEGPRVYRYRHPDRFIETETTDPTRARKVAEHQQADAHRRVKAVLQALTEHDARGLALLDEWGAAVHELAESRAHLATLTAQWADAVLPVNQQETPE